jgi:hypothetical protein
MHRLSSRRSRCSINNSQLNDRRKSAAAARDFIAGRSNVFGVLTRFAAPRTFTNAIQTRNTAIARIQSRKAPALVLSARGESLARTSRRTEVDQAIRQPETDRVLAGSLHLILACPQGIILVEIDPVEPPTAREARRSPAGLRVPGEPLALAPGSQRSTTRQLDAGECQIFIRENAHARTRLSIAGGCCRTRHATPGTCLGRHRRSGVHRHRGEIIDHDRRNLV